MYASIASLPMATYSDDSWMNSRVEPSPDVGSVVDSRYVLRRLIARGGMGFIFEAQQSFTRRSVAIKLLTPEFRSMQEAQGRLLREALALAAVRNAGFVEVLDAGVCDEHGPYVVMEMLEGRSLDGILAARRRLSPSDVVHIGLQVCVAIGHAHSRGILHRDLKPSNIFIARSELGQEIVKVIDMGVAAVSSARLGQQDRKLTFKHEILGTPEYMAPEQLLCGTLDVRTDVYALGMTLFECLTGSVAFSGGYPDVLRQVASAHRPPRMRDLQPDVPAALAHVIERALEKDPADRFQDAASFSAALRAAIGHRAPRSELLGGLRHSGPPSSGLVLAPTVQNTLFMQPAFMEQRRFARTPYVTHAVLVGEGEAETEARCEEISEGGMLVVSPILFAEGSSLRARFALPVAGTVVDVEVVVRWVSGNERRGAMGLEFVDAPVALREVAAQYAELFEPLEYDETRCA